MIKLTNINKRYGYSLNGVHDITYTFNDNGLYFIEGTSGCGKTTLLNILGGIDTYDSGSYVFWERELRDLSEEQLEYIRANYIGYIFQDFKLFTNLTVLENVEIGCNSSNRAFYKNIDKVLNELGILEFKHKKVKDLSAGQKQRVAIARALIKNPRVLLCDEPTGNLDSESSKQVMNILKEISKKRLVIVVSHDHDLVKEYANYSILMKDGKIIENYTYGSFGEQEKSSVVKVEKPKISFNNFLYENFRILRHSLEENIAVYFVYLLICILLSVSFSFISFNENKALYNSVTSAKEKYVVTDHEYEYFLENKLQKYIVSSGYYHYLLKDQVDMYGFYESPLANITDSEEERANSTKVYVGEFKSEYNLELLSGTYPINDNDLLISSSTYELIKDKTSNYLNKYNYSVNICGVYKDDFKNKRTSVNEHYEQYKVYGAYLKDTSVLNNNVIEVSNVYENLYGSNKIYSIDEAVGSLTYGSSSLARGQIVINKSLFDIIGKTFTELSQITLYYDLSYNVNSGQTANIFNVYYELKDGVKVIGIIDDGLTDMNVYFDNSTYQLLSGDYFNYYSPSFILVKSTYDNINKLGNNGFVIYSYYSSSVYDFEVTRRIIIAVLIAIGILLVWYGISFLKRDIDQLFKERREEIGTLLSIGVSKKELYFALTSRYIIMVVVLFAISLALNVPLYLFINHMISNTMFAGISTTIIFVNYLLNIISFIILLAVVVVTALKRLKKIKNNNVVYWMKNDE